MQQPLQTTGLASASSKNRLALSKCEIQLTAFFQIPQILSASGQDVNHVPGHISFLGFDCDISDCHILPVRAWTPALN